MGSATSAERYRVPLREDPVIRQRMARVHTEDVAMKGHSESTHRYTEIHTIGGGTSEIQRNSITRRGLGLVNPV